jgi:hypothetical protein
MDCRAHREAVRARGHGLIFITSSLIYYSWLTFGESLAAFLIALLAVAALRRWSPLAIAL